VAGAKGPKTPPFGELTALSSGAFVALIPERNDIEYFALVAKAKSGAAAEIDFSAIPIVERHARPGSSSVTAIAARYAATRKPSPRDRELKIAAELAPPSGLPAIPWGSLVHAVLESRLGPRPLEPGGAEDSEIRLPPKLRETLEEALGGEGPARDAIVRASRLAQVFLSSELGQRALASGERYVELDVAIGLEYAVSTNARPSANAPRYARGIVDLAFAEADRIVVVDYKTDGAVASGEHDVRVAAYGRAVAAIFAKPVELWVFYLYGGGIALKLDANGEVPSLEDALVAESL